MGDRISPARDSVSEYGTERRSRHNVTVVDGERILTKFDAQRAALISDPISSYAAAC